MGTVTSKELATREVDAKPYAVPRIDGRRDIGYGLESAFAEIISNTITAVEQSSSAIFDTPQRIKSWASGNAARNDLAATARCLMLDHIKLFSMNTRLTPMAVRAVGAGNHEID